MGQNVLKIILYENCIVKGELLNGLREMDDYLEKTKLDPSFIQYDRKKILTDLEKGKAKI